MWIKAVTGKENQPRSKSQIDYISEKLTLVIKNNKHMTRKHNLMMKRALKEKIRILKKEKISIKNKKTEIISLSSIDSKSIPNEATITIKLKLKKHFP